ncbi:MAG: flagellar basal body rod protein FlgB [Opitutales bacterium]|jgi:flagellar basal-body rod protein FlgB
MIEGIFTNDNYMLARKTLDYNNMRHEALAANLASVEVPGYKRMDVSASDFQAQLGKALQSGNKNAMDSVTPQISMDLTAVSSRRDGNNVEMDKELMEINSNALEYEYVTRYINHDYQMIRSAISGQ